MAHSTPKSGSPAWPPYLGAGPAALLLAPAVIAQPAAVQPDTSLTLGEIASSDRPWCASAAIPAPCVAQCRAGCGPACIERTDAH